MHNLRIVDSLLIIFVTLALALLRRRHVAFKLSRGIPLPPGPQRRPLIGSLLDFPRYSAWLKFTEWKDKYGDVMYLEALGNGILVLNTLDAVNDLLEKRANNYSDRPEFVMVGKLWELNKSIPMLEYGPTYKQQKKLTHLALSPEAVKKYHAVQEDLTALYLRAVLEQPDEFIGHLRLTSGRFVMSVTYGLPVDTPDHIYITDAEETMEMIGKATVPGAFLVDLLPWLQHLPPWLPFNNIHETGAAGRKKIYDMVTRPYEHVKREYIAGTAAASFTLDCIESVAEEDGQLPQGEMNEIIRWAAGALYGAGAETTYTTTLNFIMAMALYPRVQAKLKEEIDRVIGTGRLPTSQDRPHLPYVNATIKEALRWRVALPLSIARKTKAADFYRGYYIPEGTIVLPNVWAISKDTISGIPAEEFAPERFLAEKVNEVAIDPYLYAFGFGRRFCPGKPLGDNNLFLLICSLMLAMDISQKVDTHGNMIPINPEYSTGLVSYPKSFQVNILPRSVEVTSLIKERASQID